VQSAWPALLRSCQRALPEVDPRLCARCSKVHSAGRRAAREWLMRTCSRIASKTSRAPASGLITATRPLLDARRAPDAGFRARCIHRQRTSRRVAILDAPGARHGAACTSGTARPGGSRTSPTRSSARPAGSRAPGRLRITEPTAGCARCASPTRATTTAVPVGRRWLIPPRRTAAGQASWPAIKAWRSSSCARERTAGGPTRGRVLPREPVAGSRPWPRGPQGVALTPGRSIAVDPRSVPYGTPVWIDTTEPLSSRPLQRLVLAQDTAVPLSAPCGQTISGAGMASGGAGRSHAPAVACGCSGRRGSPLH